MRTRTTIPGTITSTKPSSVDFTRLTNLEAVARVRQLHAQGLREPTLQALTNWNRSDLWRALTPAPARADE